jgi:hypothetical protein
MPFFFRILFIENTIGFILETDTAEAEGAFIHIDAVE